MRSTIKDSDGKFFNLCKQEHDRDGNVPDLDFYFDRDFFFRPKSGADGVKKNPGWHKGRQVRSNGVELHVLYEKNKNYMANGRPARAKNGMTIDEARDWELPKTHPSSGPQAAVTRPRT
jgi:hypothetical protein